MKKLKLFIPLFVICGMLIFIVACSQPDKPASSGSEGANTSEPTEQVGAESAQNEEVDNSKIIPAKEWADAHPKEYETFMMNKDISLDYPGAPETRDYLTTYPALETIYKGSKYDIEYTVPRTHYYTLDTVINTARPKATAACLNCKTADYMIAEQNMGEALYTADFMEVASTFTNDITCYDCHGNQPGVINVLRSSFNRAMDKFDMQVDDKVLACGQCHNEYYFSEETGEVVHPYVYGSDPDSVLKYYNEINHVDFVQPDTGIGLIKVQHPEYETFTNNSPHFLAGLSCVDCHMSHQQEYTSHYWTTPFKDTSILKGTCLKCHSSSEEQELVDTVNQMQADSNARVTKISEELEQLTLTIAQNKANYDADTWAQISSKYRDAQFYWDFVFVENSDGFHNSQHAKDCFDKSEALIAELKDLV
ncbi:MAG: ammonia-forming cytochrome c nitrite reductase subunit c552 [Coriobacteriia bacterium]|nr:ammonia-forming cytochrome c nitrite reductase subunit c552 [Coriobacteriia bacterium]